MVVVDKTQVFHDKIQIKQKELQPWTAQINEMQAFIDIATSERDALAKKAEALKTQCKEADEALGALREEQEVKVSITHIVLFEPQSIKWYYLVPKAEQQDQLKSERDKLKRDIQTSENKLKVMKPLY